MGKHVAGEGRPSGAPRPTEPGRPVAARHVAKRLFQRRAATQRTIIIAQSARGERLDPGQLVVRGVQSAPGTLPATAAVAGRDQASQLQKRHCAGHEALDETSSATERSQTAHPARSCSAEDCGTQPQKSSYSLL